MEERTPLPSHAIIGGACRILADVVEHASSPSRVCLFKAAGDESRYVSEDEWLEGAAQYERTAREKALVDKDSTGAEKLALFRSLFRGRDDVYARGYFNKREGKIGYAPACALEDVPPCPHTVWSNHYQKCGTCELRTFQPLTNRLLGPHLTMPPGRPQERGRSLCDDQGREDLGARG